MSEEESHVVVIDNGSCSIKAGFAADTMPRTTFPTVVGTAKTAFFNGASAAPFLGSMAESNSGIVNADFPIRHGVVTNWESMERIWFDIFHNELHVEPEETPVLLTEPAFNPKGNRKKMTEIMFESFHVPSMNISPQPALSLYASGRNSGMVVESGDGVTYCVPLYTGFCIPQAITRFDIAGSDITNYLQELLKKKGCSFSRDSFSDYLTVRDMKEKLGYVALDFDSEMKKTESELAKEYELPDGSNVSIGSERFRCAELLFHPELVGFAGGGLHEAIYKSVQKCDIAIRRTSLNIILGGGNTLFRGITDRLTKEILALVPPTWPCKVVNMDGRGISAWLGGSFIASLSTFSQTFLSKEEYEEKGAEFVQLKCPPLVPQTDKL